MIPAYARQIESLIDPNCIRPGDLLLVRNSNPNKLQSNIEAYQRRFWKDEDAQWTHAATVLIPYDFIEMGIRGPHRDQLWFYQTGEWELKIRRIKDSNDYDGQIIADAVLDTARSYAKYDLASFFKFLALNSPSDYNNPRRSKRRHYICSALYVHAVERLGKALGTGIDPHFVTPAMLSSSSYLEDVDLEYIQQEEFQHRWQERSGN